MTSLRRLASAAALAGVLGGAIGAMAAPASALNDPEYRRQYGTQLVGASAAWDAGLFGEGVEIAVVDSGVHLSHQDLRANIAPGKNFVDPSRPPQDDNKHGTHVAGIAAASIDNGGTVGVAPKARIVPLKVFDSSGASVGSGEDRVSAAIRFAADSGAEVINLSLGDFGQFVLGPSTTTAIRYAWAKGSICVFAAGNDYVFESGFTDEPAIVVASTGPTDEISSFSNGVGSARWGMAAPGEGIFSTLWVADDQTNTYGTLSGTSMSAPLVSGAAALLRAAGLTPQETVDRLLATAKDLGAKGRDSTYGAGRLDVARAVQGLSAGGAPPAPAPAPAAAPLPTPTPAPTTTTAARGPATATTARSATAARPPTSPAPLAAPTAVGVGGRPATDSASTVLAPVVVVPTDDDTAPSTADAGFAAKAPAPRVDRVAWPLVAIALVAALAVAAATGRLVWRRRGERTPSP